MLVFSIVRILHGKRHQLVFAFFDKPYVFTGLLIPCVFFTSGTLFPFFREYFYFLTSFLPIPSTKDYLFFFFMNK